jgi:hypothetical protein
MLRRIVICLRAVLGIGMAQAKFISDLDAAGTLLAEQSGRQLRPFSTRDFGRDKFPGARSVLVDPARAADLVMQMRKHLEPGLVAFAGTGSSLADPPVQGTEVIVGKGTSQMDILRIAATDAINYGMQTEDLVNRLRQWDAAYGIDIYMADSDTIELHLKTLPPDLHAFAKELYAFCPDIVDQGIGTVEKLEESIRQSHDVFLWWD